MSNLKLAPTDPRSFYGTQSLMRTTMGMSPETGHVGYDTRLYGTPVQIVPLTVDFDAATVLRYDLPHYVTAYQVIVARAAGAGALADLAVTNVAGAVQTTLISGLVCSAQSPAKVALTNPMVVQDETAPRVLVVTPTAGVGVGTILLELLPILNSWR